MSRYKGCTSKDVAYPEPTPALGIQLSGAEGDSFVASLMPVIGRYRHEHELGALLESTSFFLVAGLAVSCHDPR